MKEDKTQRLLTERTSQKRIGLLNQNSEIVSLEFFVDDIGLDIVEELEEIRQGKKKIEETDIQLNIKVLNSLSNAVNALANYKNSQKSWVFLNGFAVGFAVFFGSSDWSFWYASL